MAVFSLRVLGQIEVALAGPEWLGPMCRWYSGLVPYALLLPIQIALLMIMTLVTYQHIVGRGALIAQRASSRRCLLHAGLAYALIMLIRLILALGLSDGRCGYGEIPIVTHWVLAGYLALLALAPAARP